MNNLINDLVKLSLKQSKNYKINHLLKTNQLFSNQIRNRGSAIQLIRGLPRPQNPFKKTPLPHDYKYRPIIPEDGEYTTKRLPVKKLGGRDPVSGKVVVRTVGGGIHRKICWVDYTRSAPENGTFEEKVYKVKYTAFNTHLIALVANEGNQRWIVASEFTKPGDTITTHNIMPEIPIKGKEGDTYPVGSLMPGTLIHHIEKFPNNGAVFCTEAGMHAKIIRRIGKKIIIKLPSNKEAALDEKCYVTVGKVSNTNHYRVNIACPQRMRWKGGRPASGLFKLKDGYCGRKVKPPKPIQDYDIRKEEIKYEITQPVHIVSDHF